MIRARRPVPGINPIKYRRYTIEIGVTKHSRSSSAHRIWMCYLEIIPVDYT